MLSLTPDIAGLIHDILRIMLMSFLYLALREILVIAAAFGGGLLALSLIRHARRRVS
jgi:hypothetical protein